MSNIGELIQTEIKERPPHLRFERIAVENPTATREAGYSISVDIDYVTVTQAGGGGNGVKWKIKQWKDYMDREVINGRFHQKWQEDALEAYRRWQNGQEVPVNGTPIRGWLVISPAAQANLIAKGILTVEDLAALNDEGMRRIGMGAVELKNKALAALQAAKSTGPLIAENANMKSELAILKGNYAELERKFNEVLTRLPSDDGYMPAPPPVTEISAAAILDDAADREVLTEQYIKKFGEPPHHRMKIETIQRALSE